MAFDNSDFVNLLNFYKENDNFPDNARKSLVKYLNQTMMQEHLKIH